jgi:hypothetical protein
VQTLELHALEQPRQAEQPGAPIGALIASFFSSILAFVRPNEFPKGWLIVEEPIRLLSVISFVSLANRRIWLTYCSAGVRGRGCF